MEHCIPLRAEEAEARGNRVRKTAEADIGKTTRDESVPPFMLYFNP
jgi:hypothetical protein